MMRAKELILYFNLMKPKSMKLDYILVTKLFWCHERKKLKTYIIISVEVKN